MCIHTCLVLTISLMCVSQSRDGDSFLSCYCAIDPFIYFSVWCSGRCEIWWQWQCHAVWYFLCKLCSVEFWGVCCLWGRSADKDYVWVNVAVCIVESESLVVPVINVVLDDSDFVYVSWELANEKIISFWQALEGIPWWELAFLCFMWVEIVVVWEKNDEVFLEVFMMTG